MNTMNEAKAQDVSYFRKALFVRKDGTSIPVLSKARQIPGQSWMGVVLDISQMVKYEETVEKQNLDLQAALHESDKARNAK